MKRITVFCGSSPGFDASYMQQAYHLGQYLAGQGIGVVYGGAQVGLMGAVADGALAAGGDVTGIIPRFLRTKEIAHEGLSELILADSMHERKTMMHERCDGIIALPGGFGTLEELFEMLTWAQLGLHRKPIGLLNLDGFYDPLLQMIRVMTDTGFVKPADQQLLLAGETPAGLLEQMRNYQAPQLPAWLRPDEV